MGVLGTGKYSGRFHEKRPWNKSEVCVVCDILHIPVTVPCMHRLKLLSALWGGCHLRGGWHGSEDLLTGFWNIVARLVA